jgi:two-component system sensor histidine kinase PilS (NtrC family)
VVCAAERFLAKDNQWKARQRETLASHELNRRILALVTGFRLALAAALVLVATLQPSPPLLGARYPLLFIGLICIYAVVSVVVALMLRDSGRPTVSIAWVQLIFDIVCIVLIVHSSGGSSSGIESLLVVFVISIGMTLPPLSCYLAAVLASLAIMLEQSISFMQGASTATDFITVGSSAAIMLAMSLAIRPLVRRVSETAELARQRGIDLENVGQLNEYIIQNLREAIIVIDEKYDIRLINEAALEQLGIPDLHSGSNIADGLPQLQTLLSDWRANNLDLARDIPSFLAADGITTINAHFAPLSDDHHAGPVLIFLEDASLLANKVQQSKLAALGRLSASIAHEIRNPVGALSHAAQLLRESPEVSEQDQRFIEIINTNSRRVSEIIDNILQLSRRDAAKPQRLHLKVWTQDFVDEFLSTLELYEGQVSVADAEDIEVRMDPSHLRQVIWNLCENAVKYASETAGAIAVELNFGRTSDRGRPYLEISDQGPGIPPDMEESVFEPFATGRNGGTGLGLYICRELCERNEANLRYRSREGGGSIFQIVFADPDRWET